MPTYEYEIQIAAPTIELASRKAKAAAVIFSGLTTEEMEKLAWVIKNEPHKLDWARRFLGLKK
ncbi:MAG: hypothetical protein AB1458_12040 [Bacteroidota bacterium]